MRGSVGYVFSCISNLPTANLFANTGLPCEDGLGEEQLDLFDVTDENHTRTEMERSWSARIHPE